MIRRLARYIAVVVFPAGALALAGCAVKDATKFYVLSATPASPRTSATSAVSSLAVGVGPVLLPGYLDRVQIVTRDSSDEIQISVYHRWAEPLENGIAQVVADDLAAVVGSERIAVYPWRGGVSRVLDYQVAIQVLRFEGAPGRQATLDARWRLLNRDGQEIVLKRSTITEPISGEGYQPLVLGLNRALGTLAGEIAAEIQSRANTRAAGS